MANLVYMTITGEKQGSISQGCGTYDSMGNKCQINHLDQIFVLALTHSTHRQQHINHQPISITKLIDKSSPLLGVAIANNENCSVLSMSTVRIKRDLTGNFIPLSSGTHSWLTFLLIFLIR